MDSPSDIDTINQWLTDNPGAALLIAKYAVNGLWITPPDEDPEMPVINHDTEFGSGADYIDHVNGAIGYSGLRDVIKGLQDKRYPVEAE